jgi:hypothetical protein
MGRQQGDSGYDQALAGDLEDFRFERSCND